VPLSELITTMDALRPPARPASATRSPPAPARTRVVLTHCHLDRHGDGWEAMRDAVGSGWSLARFAEVAAQR